MYIGQRFHPSLYGTLTPVSTVGRKTGAMLWWVDPITRRLRLISTVSCLAPPRATQQTTQKPASAPPRTCRTAPNVLLHVEDLPRTSLSADRRRATLIRQAAPSPRAKATMHRRYGDHIESTDLPAWIYERAVHEFWRESS